MRKRNVQMTPEKPNPNEIKDHIDRLVTVSLEISEILRTLCDRTDLGNELCYLVGFVVGTLVRTQNDKTEEI